MEIQMLELAIRWRKGLGIAGMICLILEVIGGFGLAWSPIVALSVCFLSMPFSGLAVVASYASENKRKLGDGFSGIVDIEGGRG
jgi:hypothetical protein